MIGRRLHGTPFWTRLQHFRRPPAHGRHTIGVRFPEAKAWWCDFLDGVAHIGHDVVAERGKAGRVSVTVHLDD
ncbi:hypothetical protein ABT340_37540 [Streptosporangium sp. NPDC000239]|uniref:hypothetical protein n=1 Tax=Streptosporangium sp. NPDC000239 TaxID=3154248 RepID=UPI0033184C97